MDEQRSVGLYFMCAVTMFFIMSCITFMTYGVKHREKEMMDYWANPITQEQIDESWQKYEQRQAIRRQAETIRGNEISTLVIDRNPSKFALYLTNGGPVWTIFPVTDGDGNVVKKLTKENNVV